MVGDGGGKVRAAEAAVKVVRDKRRDTDGEADIGKRGVFEMTK